nr:MAG TPA: hypothetical protein [Caudoviricetes sp.]
MNSSSKKRTAKSHKYYGLAVFIYNALYYNTNSLKRRQMQF